MNKKMGDKKIRYGQVGNLPHFNRCLIVCAKTAIFLAPPVVQAGGFTQRQNMTGAQS